MFLATQSLSVYRGEQHTRTLDHTHTHTWTHKRTLWIYPVVCSEQNAWPYIVFRTPHKSFMKWLIAFSIEKSGFITSNWALSSYKVGARLFFFSLSRSSLVLRRHCTPLVGLKQHAGMRCKEKNSMHFKKLRFDMSSEMEASWLLYLVAGGL